MTICAKLFQNGLSKCNRRSLIKNVLGPLYQLKNSCTFYFMTKCKLIKAFWPYLFLVTQKILSVIMGGGGGGGGGAQWLSG